MSKCEYMNASIWLLKLLSFEMLLESW